MPRRRRPCRRSGQADVRTVHLAAGDAEPGTRRPRRALRCPPRAPDAAPRGAPRPRAGRPAGAHLATPLQYAEAIFQGIGPGSGAWLHTADDVRAVQEAVKDGTIEAKEAYMKAANKALFAGLLKPGDLGGH